MLWGNWHSHTRTHICTHTLDPHIINKNEQICEQINLLSTMIISGDGRREKYRGREEEAEGVPVLGCFIYQK